MTTHIMILRPSFPLLIGLLCISTINANYADSNKITISSPKGSSASESSSIYLSQAEPNQQVYTQIAGNEGDDAYDIQADYSNGNDDQEEVDQQSDKSKVLYYYGPSSGSSSSKVSLSYGEAQPLPEPELQPPSQQQAGSSEFVRLAKVTDASRPSSSGYEHLDTNNLKEGVEVYESADHGAHSEPIEGNGGAYEESYGTAPVKGATVTVYSADGVTSAGPASVSYPEPYQSAQAHDNVGVHKVQAIPTVQSLYGDGHHHADEGYKVPSNGEYQTAPAGYGYLPIGHQHQHHHQIHHYPSHPHYSHGHKVKSSNNFEHFLDGVLKSMPSVHFPNTDKSKILVDLAQLLGAIKMPSLGATVNVPSMDMVENLVKQGDKSGLSFKLPDILSLFSIDLGDSNGKKTKNTVSIGSPLELMKHLPGLSMDDEHSSHSSHSSHSNHPHKPTVHVHHVQNHAAKHSPLSMGSHHGLSVDLIKNLPMTQGFSLDGDLGKLAKKLPFGIGSPLDLMKNFHMPSLSMNGGDAGKLVQSLPIPSFSMDNDEGKGHQKMPLSMDGDGGKMLENLQLPSIDGDKLMKQLSIGSPQDLLKHFSMAGFSLDGKSTNGEHMPLSLGSHHGTSVNLIKSLAIPVNLHSSQDEKPNSSSSADDDSISIGLLKHLPKIAMSKFKLPDLKFLDSLTDLIKFPKFDMTKKEKSPPKPVKHIHHLPKPVKHVHHLPKPVKHVHHLPKQTKHVHHLPKPTKHVHHIPVYAYQGPPQYDEHQHSHHHHHPQETPKKYIMAFPLHKGNLHGHVVVEDFPYGRTQNGPYDELDPEIGCTELDPMVHAHGHGSKPVKFAVAAKKY